MSILNWKTRAEGIKKIFKLKAEDISMDVYFTVNKKVIKSTKRNKE